MCFFGLDRHFVDVWVASGDFFKKKSWKLEKKTDKTLMLNQVASIWQAYGQHYFKMCIHVHRRRSTLQKNYANHPSAPAIIWLGGDCSQKKVREKNSDSPKLVGGLNPFQKYSSKCVHHLPQFSGWKFQKSLSGHHPARSPKKGLFQ